MTTLDDITTNIDLIESLSRTQETINTTFAVDLERLQRIINTTFAVDTAFAVDLERLQETIGIAFAADLERLQETIGMAFAVDLERLQETISTALKINLEQVYENFFSTQPFLALSQTSKELLERYEIAEEEAQKILHKYKWFVSPSMTASFVFQVVRLGQRDGNQRGAINRLFIEYFSANDYEELAQTVESWRENPLFVPRMKIFRDCVHILKNTNHQYNPSNVILPTLIAQIDGILIDYLQQNGLRYSNPRQWNQQWRTHFESLTTNQYLPDLANEIILGILFQNAWPGQPLATPFTFNRHKIMHGEYTRYGRMDNTIRAFLILDFLSQL